MTKEELIVKYKAMLEEAEHHEKQAWRAYKCSDFTSGANELEYYEERVRDLDKIIERLERGDEWHCCCECEHYHPARRNDITDNECEAQHIAYYDTDMYIFCQRFKKKEAEA